MTDGRAILERAKLYRLIVRGLIRRGRWGRNPWSVREFLCDAFAPIREKYDLEPLPHFHPTDKGDWRNFYTEKTALLCYRRYEKDFETFGYEGNCRNC